MQCPVALAISRKSSEFTLIKSRESPPIPRLSITSKVAQVAKVQKSSPKATKTAKTATSKTENKKKQLKNQRSAIFAPAMMRNFMTSGSSNAANQNQNKASYQQQPVAQQTVVPHQLPAQQQQYSAANQQWLAQQQGVVNAGQQLNTTYAHQQAANQEALRQQQANQHWTAVNANLAQQQQYQPSTSSLSGSSKDAASSGAGSSIDYNNEPQPHNEHESRYADYYIPQDIKRDPAPNVGPKSKKMALGSITFDSAQHREFGIYIKDNSFFLRCEKNDPVFCERLNRNVAAVNNVQIPGGRNCPNPVDYWPRGALNKFCNESDNVRLRADMDRSYRRWHDGRCMMHELYDRVAALLRF